MKITIEQQGSNRWRVDLGDRFCDDMQWDEAIGQVIKLTLWEDPLYAMLTQQEHDARNEELYKRIGLAKKQCEGVA